MRCVFLELSSSQWSFFVFFFCWILSMKFSSEHARNLENSKKTKLFCIWLKMILDTRSQNHIKMPLVDFIHNVHHSEQIFTQIKYEIEIFFIFSSEIHQRKNFYNLLETWMKIKWKKFDNFSRHDGFLSRFYASLPSLSLLEIRNLSCARVKGPENHFSRYFLVFYS